MSITVENSIEVHVQTAKLSAVFHGAKLIELRSAAGRVLLKRDPQAGPAGIELLFADGDPVPLGRPEFSKIYAVSVSGSVAHVHIEDDDGDAFLRIAETPTGELLLEPSGQTIRRGLGGVRLNLAGIAPGHKLVASFFEGCRQELDCSLVVGDWGWPQHWEASLAILQAESGGWSICTHDTRNCPRSLRVGHEDDARTLGFDTEAIGPWHDNTAVGSLAWILDVHEGDWTVPADAYRRWLHEHINAPALRAARPDWVHDIRLAIGSCPHDPAVLDALERVIAPQKVYLHVRDWRTDDYDEYYPQYDPTDAARQFIQLASRRGFRVHPHFNHFAVDPGHPLFPRVRDFVMRDVRNGKVQGWRWRDERRFAFPQSPSRLAALRQEKTMVYLHTGASTWRRELTERIAAAVRQLGTSGISVDQTLATFNLQNGLVENLTSPEGVIALTRELSALDGPPSLAGEGRDEMIMRYLSFGATPLFKTWRRYPTNYQQLDPVPVAHRLYGDLCRAWGTREVHGLTDESNWCIETFRKLETLPALSNPDMEMLTNPPPGVKRILERATS